MDKVLAPIEESAKTIQSFYHSLGENTRTLLGYVMNLGYDEGVLVTNDYYKMRAGGISKNSFLVIRPGPVANLIHPQDRQAEADFTDRPPHLILVRVLEPTPTPLSQDVARTYFEMHKSHMPELDVFTKSELQWGAIKISLLGTFYDHPDNSGIAFGADIENYLSPHLYTVHVPNNATLETLINAFVENANSQEIGHLRFTESLLSAPTHKIPIRISPHDFIGARTALFGKTRLGKSNTVKIIAKMTIDSNAPVGQLIFDPNGEYSFSNDQDDTTCLYDMYPDRCTRYTVRSIDSLTEQQKQGTHRLRVNFYDRDNLAYGHQIICNLNTVRPPDYLAAFYGWEIPTSAQLQELRNENRWADYTRNARACSIYQCCLHRAGYQSPNNLRLQLHMNEAIKRALATEFPNLPKGTGKKTDQVADTLPINDAAQCFEKVWDWYRNDPKDSAYGWLGGNPYFDAVSEALLAMQSQRSTSGTLVSGYRKIIEFRPYHDRDAGRFVEEIIALLGRGQTVTVDLSVAPEKLVKLFGEMLCTAIFKNQMERFTSRQLGDHFVQFYFEEAHTLFPRDDKDLTNIYNRLAKEGAKFHIGLVYSTQSIQSLSPDLLKNTENFFIAHLNDQAEINTLTRFHEFRDVGSDIQRTKTPGFVRMITRSHKFALPVQINRFKAIGH